MTTSSPASTDPFAFSGPVGRNAANLRPDVIKAQILLANAGYLDLPYPGVPTGWPAYDLVPAITRLQKDRGMDPDGVLLPLPPEGIGPQGEGETLAALKREIDGSLAGYGAPTPEDVDRFYEQRGRQEDDGEPPTDIVTLDEQARSGAPLGARPAAATAGTILRDIDDEPLWQDGGQVARMPAGNSLLRPGPSRRGIEPPHNWPTEQYVPPTRVQPAPAPSPRRQSTSESWTPPTQAQEQQMRDALRQEEPQRNPRASGSLLDRLQQQDAHRQWQDFLQGPAGHADNDAGASPALPQPEEDRQQTDFARPQRGRVVIAEDGRELHVPPLENWVDGYSEAERELANRLNDLVAIEMAKSGADDKRGSPQTRMEINIYIQECLEALRAEFPDADVRHVAGGTQDGENKDYLKEEHLHNFDATGRKIRTGSRRPDFSFEIARNIALRARGNTVDTNRDGTASSREDIAGGDISNYTDDESFAMAGKAAKGTSAETIRKEAQKFCRALALDIRRKFEATGEFDRPAPATPAKYEGPANLLRALGRKRGQP